MTGDLAGDGGAFAYCAGEADDLAGFLARQLEAFVGDWLDGGRRLRRAVHDRRLRVLAELGFADGDTIA